MKLILKEQFSLETESDTYTGELVSLTKKQLKTINNISPAKDIKEVKKVSTYLEISREMQPHLTDKTDILQGLETIKQFETEVMELNEKIDAFDIEDIYKERMKLSIIGDDKAAILDLGEVYGYKKVFLTIQDDIKERNEKN